MTKEDKLIYKSLLLTGSNIEFREMTLFNFNLGKIFKEITLINYMILTDICLMQPQEIFSTEELINKLVLFLNRFTDHKWEYSKDLSGVLNTEHTVLLNIDNVGQILDVFKMMYCLKEVKKESERTDIDDEMKELLKEFEEEEQKVRNSKTLGKSAITLHSIVNGVACRHPALNLLNIWDYTVYQLFQTYYTLTKIDSENRAYIALFSGNLDKNARKQLDLPTLHWATEVETNIN